MRYYKHKDTFFHKKEEKSFLIKTNRAVHSLHEVECFLHDLNKAFKYIHLYKFLK